VSARLIWPKVRGEIVHEDGSVRAVDREIYGTAAESGHLIPPHAGLPASVLIMIRGELWRKPGKEIHATVGVKDDEGNEQRVKVRMRVIPCAGSFVNRPASELVAQIADPIEREVVSVLQAELPRYEKHGRRVGGLGSIHLLIGGKVFDGATTDSWNPNSAKNQSITDNPEAVELQSDNLEALLAVYSGLGQDDEKARFASALLDRLDPGKGYLSISYFIVCALWKIGRLREALARAKTSLPQGEIKVFGLSNVLMLLNMLLRYRYTDFDNDALDETERLLLGLNEHAFQIPEKIAAIRTMRLRERAAGLRQCGEE
jgi:hypothetical protein